MKRQKEMGMMTEEAKVMMIVKVMPVLMIKKNIHNHKNQRKNNKNKNSYN